MSTVADLTKLQADTKVAVDAVLATVASVSDDVTSVQGTVSKVVVDFQALLAAAQTGQPLDLSVGQGALASLQAANTSLGVIKSSLDAVVTSTTASDPGPVPAPPTVNP